MACVPIPGGRPVEPAASASLLGTSPAGGCSGSRGDAKAPSARKLYRRIQYDAGLEQAQFSVGLLETREQAERKSGAEAWSLRVRGSVTELSFRELEQRCQDAGEEFQQFHRIMWIKQNGVVVWEAEHARAKALGAGSGEQPHVQPAGLLGCSPPAGGFMARLAAACPAPAHPGAGLPPRCSSSPGEQHWRPPRCSGTDLGGSGGSWSGGPRCGSSPGGSHHALAHSPMLGSSPVSASSCGGHAGGSALLGTSPRPMAVSWGAPGAAGHSSGGGGGGSASLLPGGACGRQALGGDASFLSASSPGGSASSSFTGTSPLTLGGAAGWPHGSMPPLQRDGSVGAGGSSAAAGLLQAGGAAAGEEDEAELLPDFSNLPEECLVDVLQRLGVRELCCIARVSRCLRGLASRPCLWSRAYARLFGSHAPADWSGATVKRLCRRSELRASRWLEAELEGRSAGFPGTRCLQLDDSKVVSGDGCAVRLWAHESGRRIATLRHAGRVTAVAFDDEFILSGCSQGGLKLWCMDDLKLLKSLRHHTGALSACLLLAGMPVSAGADGTVCMWDAGSPNSPLVVLEAGSPVQAMALQEERGHLLTGSATLGVWDIESSQLLATLEPPAGALPSSVSSASLAALAGAGASGTATPAAVQAEAVAAGLDADEALLLHDGWLLDDDSSSDEDDEQQQQQQQQHAAAGSAGGAAPPAGEARPWTSLCCYGNLLAAGRAGSVVLWDLRSQEPVGALPASGARASCSLAAPAHAKSASAACVGVQLDDWRLLTGFAGAASSGGGSAGGGGGGSGASSSGNSAWWHAGAEGWDGEGWGDGAASGVPGQHSLELYDVRAAASFSSCSTAAASGPRSGGGLWSAAPVLSVPLPSRVTCFQFHGQHLLAGQEGADCCLFSFHPPGSRSGRAAAAWGFGPGGGAGGYRAAGVACYGASPGGAHASPGAAGAWADEAGGPSGGKGRKKGAAKVPAKRQTRFPKRTTR